MTVHLKVTEFVLYLFILVATFVLGAGIVKRVGPASAWAGDRLLFSFALGLGLLSYGVFFIGLLGWLSGSVLAILIGVCFACGLILIRMPERPHLQRAFPSDKHLPSQPILPELPFIALLVLINGMTWILCFLPPLDLRLEWDSLSYQLAVPKIYWQEGKIRYIPFTHHAQFPSLMPMLYLIGLAVTGGMSATGDPSVSVAKMFHWTYFLIIQFTLLIWGASLSPRSLRAGLIAASLFASVPVAHTEATTAYSDLALTAYIVLSIYCLSRADGDSRWLLLAGSFAGFAAGTKYTGLSAILFLPFYPLLSLFIRQKVRWASVALSFLIAVAVASPWYVKNWLWTGNPVFPFAFSRFGGKNWSAEMARSYDLSNKEFGAGRDLRSVLFLPVSLTFNEVRSSPCARQWLGFCRKPGDCASQWKCRHFENQDIPDISLGPFFLVFLAPIVVLLVSEPPPRLLFPLAGFLLWFSWWFWSAQYLRYLLPAIGLVCYFSGVAADRLIRSSLLTGWIVRIGTLVAITYGFLFLVARTATWWDVALGLTPTGEVRGLMERAIPGYSLLRMIRSLPSKSVIATYGYPFGFFIDRPYYWADPGHNRLIQYERILSVKDLIDQWRSRGTDYVIIHWRFVKDLRFTNWIRQGLKEGLLQRVGVSGEVELLEVVKGDRQ